MLAKAEIYLIVIAVAALAAMGWGYKRYHEGVTDERGRWELKVATATKADLDDLTKAVKTANEIAGKTQDELAKRKSSGIIDRGVIEREIHTNTVYASNCLPDTGRMQWDAISKAGTVLPDSSSGLKIDTTLSNGDVSTSKGRDSGITPIKPPRRANPVR